MVGLPTPCPGNGADETAGRELVSCDAVFIPQTLTPILDDTLVALVIEQAKAWEHVVLRAQHHTCLVWPSTWLHAAGIAPPSSDTPGKPTCGPAAIVQLVRTLR